MYEKHFSFKYKPFELVPNPEFLFLSSTHKKAMTYIDYGIKEKIGFILLTGEVGSGKTTIIRNLMKGLNGSVKLSRINNTKVSSAELIAMINEDFGLDVDGKNKTKLLSELNDFLIRQYANGAQPVLMIDEAQNLSSDLLEEIRLLSNLETDKSKLLQIILIGQPELKKALMLPDLIQLRQRINIKYHLKPLSYEETASYIKHRLSIAGNTDAIHLTHETQELIYNFSRGIPRLINIICDFALLSAFAEGETVVELHTMKEILKDLESHEYVGTNSPGSQNVESEDSGELREAVGDIALRLIKLEEFIKKTSSDRKLFLERIKNLEAKVNGSEQGDENKKVNEIFEKMEEKLVSRILVKLADENMLGNLVQRVADLEKIALSSLGKNSENTHP